MTAAVALALLAGGAASASASQPGARIVGGWAKKKLKRADTQAEERRAKRRVRKAKRRVRRAKNAVAACSSQRAGAAG